MLLAVTATTLLAVVHARVLSRCGLARELAALGVRDQLATWVCIAYHESRLDTAARNPSSGDHGLLQISELYWCGSGKVCAPSCDVFRDDDIADDVACALGIHEEHTRLQGDGFLAWVVYPQHCRHNAKKYLADCDATPAPPGNSSRLHRPRYVDPAPAQRNINDLQHGEVDLQPPYLSIKSLVRNNYNSIFGQDRRDWTKFKLDNIDELKLPVFTNKPPPPLARGQSPASSLQPPTRAEPPARVQPPAEPQARTEPPVQPQARLPAPARTQVRNQITDDDIRKAMSGPSSYVNKPKINHESTSFTSVGTTKSYDAVTSRPSLRTYKPFVFTSSPRWSTTPAPPRAAHPRATLHTTATRPPPTSRTVITTTVTTSPRTDRSTLRPLPPLQQATRSPETTTELNIFDFYLRQNARRPALTTYAFGPPRAGLSIFAGGTTPLPATAGGHRGGVSRNYVRRQIQVDGAR